MTDTGQALFDDLTGINGPDPQEEALRESVELMVRQEFQDRRVVGVGDVKSCNIDGTNFLYL